MQPHIKCIFKTFVNKIKVPYNTIFSAACPKWPRRQTRRMLIQDPFIQITAFIFGAAIGSFLNVCIYRLPEKKSIVSPPSACPQCGSPIRFYDNIPIVSYIILMGKCRHCKTGIPLRYAVVEALTGLCATACTIKFGLTPEAGIYFVFIAALIVVIYIDIDHKIIPNRITLPGIPLFYLASLAVPGITARDTLIGIAVGGGSLWLVAWIYQLITKREGMGMGDIKLLAMIGALIGWKGVLFTIYFGSATGTVIGIATILAQGKNFKFAIPFGPFLSTGAITYIFFGDIIINWYFNAF